MGEGYRFEGIPPAWKRLPERMAGRLPGKRIGVAVSGGGDSVALLRLLKPIHDAGLCALVVLHVDHGWRPESASEADWVRSLAESLGLPCRCAASSPRDDGGRIVCNEAAARAGRFAAFATMAAEERLDAIALGHNADDQVETLLMRLVRGTSLQGLGGIRERRRIRVNGRPLLLWRPLLRSPRADLRGFLENIGQTWLEDPSNASPRFLRNRIRSELLPVLERLRPGLAGRLVPLAEDLQSASKAVRARAARLGAKSDVHSIAISAGHEDFLLREALRLWLIRKVKIEEPARPALDRLAELVRAGTCGRALRLRGRTIVRTRAGLEVLPARTGEASLPETVLEEGREAASGDWSYTIDGDVANPSETIDAVWINSDIYSGPFTLRARRPGDRFRQAGGPGGKKLSRWLVDRHVPRHRRDGMPLVACGADIVWIPGMAVAEGVKTTPVPGWRVVSRRRKAP